MTQSTFDLSRLDLAVPNEGPVADQSRRLRMLLRLSVPNWEKELLVRPHASFGLVVASLDMAGYYDSVWDDPQALISDGMAIGWGSQWNRYAANALRKIRATARSGVDTMEMIETLSEEEFLDPVESFTGTVDSPTFEWGDFPHPGAVILGEGPTQRLVAVSSLTGQQDDMVATLAAKFLRLPEVLELLADPA